MKMLLQMHCWIPMILGGGLWCLMKYILYREGFEVSPIWHVNDLPRLIQLLRAEKRVVRKTEYAFLLAGICLSITWLLLVAGMRLL